MVGHHQSNSPYVEAGLVSSIKVSTLNTAVRLSSESEESNEVDESGVNGETVSLAGETASTSNIPWE